MGHLLVDDLLKGRTQDGYTQDIQTRLRLPIANHSSIHHRPEGSGLVDRIVFDKAATDVCFRELCEKVKSIHGEDPSLWTFLQSIKLPTLSQNPIWIEAPHINIGWYIEGGLVSGFQRRGSSVKRVAQFDETVLDTHEVEPVYYHDIDESFDFIVTAFWFSLLSLASPRVTSTRLVQRGGDGGVSAALARRRFQIGRPMFSYNKVELVLPKTALHRGVLREVPDHPGVRQHLVIGHWRLIDGAIEPYWIWVDGHYRGDPSLGQIVKERHVRFTGDVRRGFLVPDGAGLPGERRKAARS